MSARDLFLPVRALEMSMESFARRLDQLSLRSSWVSATQVDELNYFNGAYTTVQDWGDPSYPTGGATTAVSLTLDPGRWVLLATVDQQIAVTGDGGEIGIELGWNDGVTSNFEYQSRRSYFPSFTIRRTFNLSFEVISDAQSYASVKVFAGADFGGGTPTTTYGLHVARLTAFPG